MTAWKRFDPYAMTFDKIEQERMPPAEVAKAAKVLAFEAAPRPIGLAAPLQGEAGGLRRGSNSWSAEDWRSFYDERAAIAEHQGGLARSAAEIQAFDCCVTEWLNRNPVVSTPDRCCWCNGGERQDNVLLPFGVDSVGHAWLHGDCWRQWRNSRESEAVAALAALGIISPSRTRSPEISTQFK
jgi:hypothetical protein